MEKPIVIDRYQEPQQQQQRQHQKPQALKCPRCDSSNTKFCYYNNYSLSQPRHFCKSCKRYWTRGGTLRNVPVGGGCRKNKRVKIPTATTSTNTTTHVITSTSQPLDHQNPNLDNLSLVYGLTPQNPNYQRFNTLVSSYDFSQPQMSDLGLRFSSPSDPTVGGVAINHSSHNSSSFFSSSYPSSSSMFAGGSTSSSTSAPIMASILASGFQHQQRFMDWSNDHFQGQNNNNNNDIQLEAMASSSNQNSLLWNTQINSGGGWFDPTSNIDSSVPSLI